MIPVPELTFDMGTAPGEPGYRQTSARHRVHLSAFAIGEAEVTNAELCDFLNDEGNGEALGATWVQIGTEASLIREERGRFVPVAGAARKPAVAVSWQGARAYCRWLSAKTGHVYDLPTAAQWEAAARAGTETAWWWGDGDDARRYRSHEELRPEGSVAVKSYAPNAWGLYDTAGNVWEWTLDCYDAEFYRFAPADDPVHLDDACLTPEVRGGSFRSGGDFCTPGYRASVWWRGDSNEIGFRVARLR